VRNEHGQEKLLAMYHDIESLAAAQAVVMHDHE